MYYRYVKDTFKWYMYMYVHCTYMLLYDDVYVYTGSISYIFNGENHQPKNMHHRTFFCEKMHTFLSLGNQAIQEI